MSRIVAALICSSRGSVLHPACANVLTLQQMIKLVLDADGFLLVSLRQCALENLRAFSVCKHEEDAFMSGSIGQSACRRPITFARWPGIKALHSRSRNSVHG